MNYCELSESGLKDLHDGLTRAFKHDRKFLDAEDKKVAASVGIYFGVDEYPDWKEQVRCVEAILKRRDISFIPIRI